MADHANATADLVTANLMTPDFVTAVPSATQLDGGTLVARPAPPQRPPRIRLRRSASGAPLGGCAEGAPGGAYTCMFMTSV